MKVQSGHCTSAPAFVIGVALFVAAIASGQDEPGDRPAVGRVVTLVNQYCGACHAAPSPDILPKRHWPALIRTMVGLRQERMGHTGISERQMNDIIALYYGSSPDELPTLPYRETALAPSSFAMSDLGAKTRLPYITNVNAARLMQSDAPQLLVCDAEARKLLLLSAARGRWRETPVADVEVPVHTQIVDIDGDGDQDILVADLGQFSPVDGPVGRVLLYRQGPRQRFERELLLDKLGRVSDARAVDLDSDGDLDIAVGVFGRKDTGEVFWLENDGYGTASGTFEKHVLLSLAGAVDVSPVDLNGDGLTDLAVLIAQEHEMIVAFVNRGGGVFERVVIARAPHPMYGSTSMTDVDLDQDGDLDLLFTNGDAFDTQTDPKPYHGVQWLENQGQMRFEFHDIGRFYGAATAVAGDIDGDGDLDVVAGSWVNYWNDSRRYAIVWHENDGKQTFLAHGIATRPAGVASLQLIDVNGDGMLDIVGGAIRMDLLMARSGSNYMASRLFPPSDEATLHSRVFVLENHLRK